MTEHVYGFENATVYQLFVHAFRIRAFPADFADKAAARGTTYWKTRLFGADAETHKRWAEYMKTGDLSAYHDWIRQFLNKRSGKLI